MVWNHFPNHCNIQRGVAKASVSTAASAAVSASAITAAAAAVVTAAVAASPISICITVAMVMAAVGVEGAAAIGRI